MTTVPNPGSDEAVGQGCTCPVVDNGRGLVPPFEDPDAGAQWWVTAGCPLHYGGVGWNA